MRERSTRWTRRRFLHGTGLASVLGGLSLGRTADAAIAQTIRDAGVVADGIYANLGVRPLVNAAGTYTALSGSIMPPEVVAAMEEASRQHVSIGELQAAVGQRIAGLLGAESALVTSGCAAALTLATAACVCGTDEEHIKQAPDTTGLKNQVILQKSHRFGYDHAIRNVGVELVEVEGSDQLSSAINDRTAMLFFLNVAEHEGAIGREEFARLAKRSGIPSLIDGAADVPPASNLRAFIEMGYDLVAFSGGKGIRGPQCSGLLLGRRDLIDAAYLNGSPHSNSVGRIGKVGKEEIVGLWKAVELYLQRDHAADWRDWEQRVEVVQRAVAGIRSVEAEPFVPKIANAVPHLAITWDATDLGLSRAEFVEALRDGDPRVEVRPSRSDDPKLEIGVWMLEPGEDQIVARRCAEVLATAAAG